MLAIQDEAGMVSRGLKIGFATPPIAKCRWCDFLYHQLLRSTLKRSQSILREDFLSLDLTDLRET